MSLMKLLWSRQDACCRSFKLHACEIRFHSACLECLGEPCAFVLSTEKRQIRQGCLQEQPEP